MCIHIYVWIYAYIGYIYIYIYIHVFLCEWYSNVWVIVNLVWTIAKWDAHASSLWPDDISICSTILCAGQSPTNENTLMFHKTILPFGFRDVKVFQQLPKRNTLVTSNPCCCTLRSQVFRILLPFNHSDYWLDKKHWQKKSISLFRGLPLLLSQEHSL